MKSEPNISLFMDWRMYDVQVAARKITSCDAHHNHTAEAVRFAAPLFIDCTGDAWLGFRTGAQLRQGREAKSEFDEGWDKFKEQWSPTTPDRLTMGGNLKFRTGPATSPELAAFPEVPWAMPVAKDHAATHSEWNSEYARGDLDQIRDGEEIRDYLLRWIYGSFSNAKKDPKHANLMITQVGYVLGRRESRRLMRDYIYAMKDMTENRLFADAVVAERLGIRLRFGRRPQVKAIDAIGSADEHPAIDDGIGGEMVVGGRLGNRWRPIFHWIAHPGDTGSDIPHGDMDPTVLAVRACEQPITRSKEVAAIADSAACGRARDLARGQVEHRRHASPTDADPIADRQNGCAIPARSRLVEGP